MFPADEACSRPARGMLPAGERPCPDAGLRSAATGREHAHQAPSIALAMAPDGGFRAILRLWSSTGWMSPQTSSTRS
jgi:hypothetical protein